MRVKQNKCNSDKKREILLSGGAELQFDFNFACDNSKNCLNNFLNSFS